uniref:Kelch-like protein 10 n=1 Tax=Mastacembelus armatus TaxID=205130 RepID=A0A7N8Y0B2_9TELE
FFLFWTLAVFTQFRLEGKLCDVVIKVDDVEFNAHRIILCSCSQYFSTLFTSAWATSTKQMYTITGVSPEMMQLIINYAYTHTVPVTEDNVVEVLAAGDQFLVPGIVQACCFFLEDQLCLRNCIGIWRLVDLYYCPELKHKVFLYILDHFEAIACVSQELLELSVEQLAVIIENDHLNVKQENTVFEAVLHWINHLPDQRRGHMSVLLPKVRLGLMTTGYLKNVIINNAVVNSSSECIAIITEAMTALRDFRDYGPSNSVYRNLLTRPRLPPAILLVIGGKYFNTFRTSLEAYDVRSDRWVTVNADIHRAHHGAAVLDRFVYLIGGSSRGTCLNTVQKFDLVTCTWHQVASMNSRRSCVSVAVQNGCIFAMGGFSRRIYYNTVERYNPEENQWTMMSPMRAKSRYTLIVTLFNHTTCSCFSLISSIANDVFVLSASSVYICGGFNGHRCLSTAEAYNPQTNRWSPVMSMHSPRSYFGIEVVDDQLVVVGGYNGFSSMPAVERYSDDTRMWYSASNIKTAHCGLSCCVLRGLRNVVEKLFLRDPLTPPNADENQS